MGIADLLSDILVNKIHTKVERYKIYKNFIARVTAQVSWKLETQSVKTLKELLTLTESINKTYWESIPYIIPPRCLIDQELIWRFEVPSKGMVIYAYPKSFFFKLWAYSIHDYGSHPIPTKVIMKITEEWVKLLFNRHLTQGSINYDEIVDILIQTFSAHSKIRETFERFMRKRSRKTQTSLCNLIESIWKFKESINLDGNVKNTIESEIIPVIEQNLIEGSPSWEKWMFLKKEEYQKIDDIKLIEKNLQLPFYIEKYYDVFLSEKMDIIREMAVRFCTFLNRQTTVDKEIKLICLWLNQFKEDNLRDIGMSLLNNLKYYTQKEMLKHYYNLIKDTLREEDVRNKKVLFIIEPLSGNEPVAWKFLRELGNKYEIRPKDVGEVVYLKDIKENDKKKLTKKLQSEKFFHIVYLDDLIGSGGTARRVLSNLERVIEETKLTDIKIRYWAICVSNEIILKKLREEFPRVEISVSEPLNELEKHTLKYVLEKNYSYLEDTECLKMMLKDICIEILSREKPVKKWVADGKIEDYALGYENGQLLVVFETNCPNNTIPIFWKDGKYRDKEFFALFPRMGKDEKYKIWEVDDIINNFFKRCIYGT